MGAIGAVFQPELIELMKAVLDDAALFARYLSGAQGSLRHKKAARG
jgi:hypothetical protein